jgi:EAL domain-containing protein (putative c-di-GMP-specific phosphodiesterase class I)
VDSTLKLRVLRQLGVDYVQGFHLRSPEHIDSFEFMASGGQSGPERACA